MNSISPQNIHVGIVPDGNRRWAKENGKMPWDGHQRGTEVMGDIVKYVFSETDIQYLTVFAFSFDNQKRSEEEKRHLFEIMAEAAIKTREYVPPEVGISFLGDLSLFEGHSFERSFRRKIQRELGTKKEVATLRQLFESIARPGESGRYLTLLAGYDPKREEAEALDQFYDLELMEGEDLCRRFKSLMYDGGRLPDFSLILRTGKDDNNRLSGFLPRLIGKNTYFEAPQIYWPDMTPDKFGGIYMDYRPKFGAERGGR
ncbi:MAG TPA: hypothetical protein ENN60_02310 [archaeon]|nr:hypothetical protein [archaeon]